MASCRQLLLLAAVELDMIEERTAVRAKGSCVKKRAQECFKKDREKQWHVEWWRACEQCTSVLRHRNGTGVKHASSLDLLMKTIVSQICAQKGFI